MEVMRLWGGEGTLERRASFIATRPLAMVVPTRAADAVRPRTIAASAIFSTDRRSAESYARAVTPPPVRGSIAVVRIVTEAHPRAPPPAGSSTTMRPTRDRPPALSALFLVSLAALVGCGKQAMDPATPPLDLVVAAPAAPRAEPPPVAPPTRAEREVVIAAADPEPEPDTMPRTWTGPIVPGLGFSDALRKARGARDAFGRLAVPAATAKDPAIKAWFAQAQAQVDQASRMYAAAFHAADAPREGRIDAIAEAAELDMSMARSLDDAGLGSMPVAWRADPAVASTFEDIAIGPTRRWRDEARVLARQCMQTARDQAVLTEAARRCAALRTGAPQKTARRGADAGAGCACDPGDPLCSASLGGWCGARP